jgi:hypothetical protein
MLPRRTLEIRLISQSQCHFSDPHSNQQTNKLDVIVKHLRTLWHMTCLYSKHFQLSAIWGNAFWSADRRRIGRRHSATNRKLRQVVNELCVFMWVSNCKIQWFCAPKSGTKKWDCGTRPFVRRRPWYRLPHWGRCRAATCQQQRSGVFARPTKQRLHCERGKIFSVRSGPNSYKPNKSVVSSFESWKFTQVE